MKQYANNIILLLVMVYPVFGKFYHGMGMQMTTDGAGIYYKRLCLLNNNSQFIGDAGLHFSNSQPRILVYGYDNNYQDKKMDLTAGFRHELYSNKIRGNFRPIFIIGVGGMSDINSFTNDNIVGIWMIKYMVGAGFYFYNRRIMNEISLLITHSEAIEDNAAFQLAFYWK